MSRKRQVMGGHRGLTSEQSRLLIFSVTHTLLKRFPHTTSVCQLERASAAASQPEITIAKAVHSPHELLRAWCGEHGQPHETKMGPAVTLSRGSPSQRKPQSLKSTISVWFIGSQNKNRKENSQIVVRRWLGRRRLRRRPTTSLCCHRGRSRSDHQVRYATHSTAIVRSVLTPQRIHSRTLFVDGEETSKIACFALPSHPALVANSIQPPSPASIPPATSIADIVSFTIAVTVMRRAMWCSCGAHGVHTHAQPHPPVNQWAFLSWSRQSVVSPSKCSHPSIRMRLV